MLEKYNINCKESIKKIKIYTLKDIKIGRVMYVLMRKDNINIILRAATAFVDRIDCKAQTVIRLKKKTQVEFVVSCL